MGREVCLNGERIMVGSEYPKTILEKFRIMLFGSYYYIYDFNMYGLVKKEDGSYAKLPAVIPRPYTTSYDEQSKEFYNLFHKLVKEDREKQLAAIEKRAKAELHLSMQPGKIKKKERN